MSLNRPESVVLVRHGEYWWNVLYHRRFDFNDPAVQEALEHILDKEEQHVALTPAGRDQARITGAALAGEYPHGFDRIFFSPWDRTTETLEIMLEAWPTAPRSRMRNNTVPSYKLVEQDQGSGVQFLARHDPSSWPYQCERLMRLINEKHRVHTKFRHKGIRMNGEAFDESMHGESSWDVALRAHGALQDLCVPECNQYTVLVVTHMAIKMWIRATMLGLTPQQTMDDLNSGRKPIANCGVSRFDYVNELRGFNGAERGWCERYWNKTHYEGAFHEM